MLLTWKPIRHLLFYVRRKWLSLSVPWGTIKYICSMPFFKDGKSFLILGILYIYISIYLSQRLFRQWRDKRSKSSYFLRRYPPPPTPYIFTFHNIFSGKEDIGIWQLCLVSQSCLFNTVTQDSDRPVPYTTMAFDKSTCWPIRALHSPHYLQGTKWYYTTPHWIIQFNLTEPA